MSLAKYLKNNTQSIQLIVLVLADCVALYLSVILADIMLHLLRPHGPDYLNLRNVGLAKLLALGIIIVFFYQEHYSKRRPLLEELRLLYITISVFAVLHLSASFLLSHHVIKLFNALFWFLLLIVLPICRYGAKRILSGCSLYSRDLFIIGTKELALEAYHLVGRNSNMGYNTRYFVDLDDGKPKSDEDMYNIHAASPMSINLPLPKIRYGQLLTVLEGKDNASNVASGNKQNKEILFAIPLHELAANIDKIDVLQSKCAYVSIMPEFRGLPLYGATLDQFFANEQVLFRLRNNLAARGNRLLKRFTDLLLATLLLTLLSPVYLLIAFCIKYTTKGKVFFKHRRIGHKGREFFCLKFQTMYHNNTQILTNYLASNEQAREEWKNNFKLRYDPRVTPIGRILRITSLDELPQLFNVIIGDMSLIGPRPIIADEIVRYGNDFYYYKLVRPGITGLWQISGRSDTNYHRRVYLDAWYVKNWSLWYDLVILLRTVVVVLTKKGAY